MSDKGDPWGTPAEGGGTPSEQGDPARQDQQRQPEWGPPAQPGQAGAPSYPPYAPQGPAYGYGQPPAWGGAPPQYGPPQTSGKATTVLVLGIVSLVLLLSCIGFIPAIVALVLAKGARREIAESGGRLGGDSQVKAGTIMSWITVGLTVLGGLLLAAVIAVAVNESDTNEPTIGRVLDRVPAAAAG